LIVFRARALAEALIRGSSTGLVGTLRAAVARAWLALGMAYVAGVFVSFIFGLSLGLLSYFHAALTSLGIILVLLVLEKLTEPGSRLQTILPMMRVGFGVLIAVVVILVVLSRLGIDTAPLIAGAGVFGLAISFGAQSLVRDVISGLFYLWDDAFRVGEYIDTGRLKGTVEALGIRSVKLRHHNGPLHTIPYGQLGAVTNQSRDF